MTTSSSQKTDVDRGRMSPEAEKEKIRAAALEPAGEAEEERRDLVHTIIHGKGELRALVCRLASVRLAATCAYCDQPLPGLLEAVDHYDPDGEDPCPEEDAWEELEELRQLHPQSYDEALRLAVRLLS